MIILDTELLPPADRAQAWIDARAQASVPSTVELADPLGFFGRFEHWRLSDVAVSRHTVNSGQRLFRTRRQVEQNAPRMLSISLQEFGTGRHEQFGIQRAVQPGRLVCTDLTAPWEFSFTAAGSARALLVDLDELDLPAAVIRQGSERLEFSPLHELATQQFADVFQQLRTNSPEADSADLFIGGVDLTRVLLLSAGAQPRLSSARRDTRAVLTRVKFFAQQHLAEADLTETRIAAGLGIPVELLREVCHESALVLADWISDRRLDRVEEELAFWSPLNAAGVAAHWGFTDPADFHRRWAEKHGRPPGD